MSWTSRIAHLLPEPKSTRDLRSFGLLVGGIFALIGVWPLVWRGEEARVWALALAVPLVLGGAFVPRALRHPYRVWMLIGHGLGWVNARILMTLIFFLAFTPAAAVMRLFGRDAMTRRFDKGAATYRVLRSPRPGSHLKHPF